MTKLAFPPTTTCALALLILSQTPGCGRKPDASSEVKLPSASVRARPVEAKRWLATEEVVGTIRARVRATLEAKISGRIGQLPVVAGQIVKKGDLLIQLEVREVQARLDQARAVEQQAAQDRKRFETLLAQKAVTQAEYDAVQARAEVAAASLAEAETMLGYALITAPFDGVISRRLAEVGDLASPGRPLLELEDPGSLRLEADVPEALIDRVQLGITLPVRVGARTNALEGVVSELAPMADPNTRTFRVKLDLPPESGLRLGQFGRVAVPVDEITSTRIPSSALVVRGQMEMVFVVVDQHARLRLVKTGKRIGDETEIVSGLEVGEAVVVEGGVALVDGQPVEVKP